MTTETTTSGRDAAQAAVPAKRKRGRPRKNPLPETVPGEVRAAVGAAVPEPGPDAGAPTPAVTVPPRGEAEPGAAEPAPPSGTGAIAVPPPFREETEEPVPDEQFELDVRARREAALRMKRGIDDMSDSIAAMQAFFAKKTSTQTAMAQQAKSLANKAAKQAAREQAAKEAAVKAAAARLSENRVAPQEPGVPPSFPGKVRVDRWGRPVGNPQQANAVQPQQRKAQPRPEPPKANPDMPVLNAMELQRCGADDLSALAEDARLEEPGAFASRHDLVLALLAEHSRRGGGIEGEGIYIPAKDQAGVLVSPLNGLRRTPSDVRVPSQLAAAAGLRAGDHVVCRAVPGAPRGAAPAPFEASDIVSVNGFEPVKARRKLPFDAFAPRVPDVRLRLGGENGSWIAEADAALPLAEGTRGLVVLPPRADPVAVLAGLAASVKEADPGLDTVVALFDPDPESVAMLATRAAADRDAGRAPSFDSVLQDAADHIDRSSPFTGALCECVRRRAACGRRVVLFCDAPGAYGPGFARSLPGRSAVGPEAAMEREALEFRRLWRTARVLDGAGSLTLVGCIRTGTDYDEALAADFGRTAGWFARLDGEGGAQRFDAARSFSRYRAADLSGAPAARERAAGQDAVPEFRAPLP